MSYRNETQVRDEYVQRMGEPLGQLFSALWHELVWLHIKWSEYTKLFGAGQERVELLNRVAPNFFGIIQSVLLDNILLHIARMTDDPKTKEKNNLTIWALPSQINSSQVDAKKIIHEINKLLGKAKGHVDSCRDLRNRRLAHTDRELALKEPSAAPLPQVSRAKVRDALRAIGHVLNALQEHYGFPVTAFEHTIPALGGAGSLLHAIESRVGGRSAIDDS